MCKEKGQNWPDSYERKSSWRSHLEGIFFVVVVQKHDSCTYCVQVAGDPKTR